MAVPKSAASERSGVPPQALRISLLTGMPDEPDSVRIAPVQDEERRSAFYGTVRSSSRLIALSVDVDGRQDRHQADLDGPKPTWSGPRPRPPGGRDLRGHPEYLCAIGRPVAAQCQHLRAEWTSS